MTSIYECNITFWDAEGSTIHKKLSFSLIFVVTERESRLDYVCTPAWDISRHMREILHWTLVLVESDNPTSSLHHVTWWKNWKPQGVNAAFKGSGEVVDTERSLRVNHLPTSLFVWDILKQRKNSAFNFLLHFFWHHFPLVESDISNHTVKILH